MWPSGIPFAFLSLNSLICKMGIISYLSSLPHGVEVRQDNGHKNRVLWKYWSGKGISSVINSLVRCWGICFWEYLSLKGTVILGLDKLNTPHNNPATPASFLQTKTFYFHTPWPALGRFSAFKISNRVYWKERCPDQLPLLIETPGLERAWVRGSSWNSCLGAHTLILRSWACLLNLNGSYNLKSALCSSCGRGH